MEQLLQSPKGDGPGYSIQVNGNKSQTGDLPETRRSIAKIIVGKAKAGEKKAAIISVAMLLVFFMTEKFAKEFTKGQPLH